MSNVKLALLIVVVFVLPGALLTRYPETFARRAERADAIGSRRDRSEVEPARWRVALEQLLGVFLLFLGLVLAAGLLFVAE